MAAALTNVPGIGRFGRVVDKSLLCLHLINAAPASVAAVAFFVILFSVFGRLLAVLLVTKDFGFVFFKRLGSQTRIRIQHFQKIDFLL